MDWSKAKNILIIAFIIMNILLGYNLYMNKQIDEKLVSEELIESTMRLLNEKGIGIKTEIPRTIEGVPSLTVDYENSDINSLNNQFFEGRGEIYKVDRDSIKVSYEEEEVLYKENKKLIYKSNKIEAESGKTPEELEVAIKIAKDFIRDRGFEVLDMKLTHSSIEDESYNLIFSKIYNDIYVEDSYTRFVIDSSGVREMERVWLRVVKEGENPIYPESAPKALLELITREEAYNKNIVDINLCYYFNLDDSEFGEDLDVRKGRAMPTWRIQLDDGQKIIVDNI